jgi:hypothetical protein
VTYYTCDDCDWAGPFAEARKHYKETDHDAFSRRDEIDAVATQPVVIERHHYYAPRPWCDHSFTWMSTLPPTHCPRCGMSLGRTAPYTITASGAVGAKEFNYASGIPSNASGANFIVNWAGSGPDGSAGLPAPKL